MSLIDKLKEYTKQGNKKLHAGIVKQKTYPNGKLVAQVGYDNEYGVPHQNIPARPFMMTTFEENRKEIPKMLAGLIAKGNDVQTAMEMVGDHLANEAMMQTMTWDKDSNAEYTIAKKGYDAPLRANDKILRDSFGHDFVDD